MMCPLCLTYKGEPLYVNLWPFNFESVACPQCGPVMSENDWPELLWRIMCRIWLWDGRMHEERHPWWRFIWN